MKKITYTTIIIGKSGKVYDLGKGEYPSPKDQPPSNAFVCTQEEADGMKRKKG